MSKTTGADRKYLRREAHPLKVLVQVGGAGLSDGLIQAVDDALADHELIKVRFQEHKDMKKELAPQIAERTGSEVAGLIGHVLILYREAAEKEDRKYVLPSAKKGA